MSCSYLRSTEISCFILSLFVYYSLDRLPIHLCYFEFFMQLDLVRESRDIYLRVPGDQRLELAGKTGE